MATQVEAQAKVEELLAKLEEMAEKGYLDALIRMLELVDSMFSSVADERTMRLVALAGGVADSLASLEPQGVQLLVDAMVRVLNESGEELLEAVANPPKIGGLLGLMRALKDPDVQRGLGIMIAIAKIIGAKLPEAIRRDYEHIQQLRKAAAGGR